MRILQRLALEYPHLTPVQAFPYLAELLGHSTERVERGMSFCLYVFNEVTYASVSAKQASHEITFVVE